MDELFKELPCNNMQSDDLARFTNISKMILEKKGTLKESCVQVKFMNENLQKATMIRSRLLNKYRKEKTEPAYKRYRNFCVKLWRKTKTEFYNNFSVKHITENKLLKS